MKNDIKWFLRKYKESIPKSRAFRCLTGSIDERREILRYGVDYLIREIDEHPGENVYILIERLIAKFDRFACRNVQTSYMFSEISDMLKDISAHLVDWYERC